MMILDPGSSRGIVPFCPFQCPAGHSLLQQALRPSRAEAGAQQRPALGQQDQHRSSGQRGKEEGLSVGQRLQVQNDPRSGKKSRHSLGLGWRKAKEAAKYSASTAHTTARIISANRSTTGSREYS